MVSIHMRRTIVRLKLFRLKAEGGSEDHDCRTLAEISDSCTKHGFKMRFFLTVFFVDPRIGSFVGKVASAPFTYDGSTPSDHPYDGV